jgi:hypothetical protein
LCLWRGSRVTDAWLFIISLPRVLSIGDTAPCIDGTPEVTVRVEAKI